MAASNISSAAHSFLPLVDFNFILLNKFFVLIVVVLFFLVIIILRRFRKQAIPASARTALKLAIFGLILLYLQLTLTGLSHYKTLLESIQSVIVLVCLAKLTIYIIVDLALTFRHQGEVPMLQRDAICLAVYLAVGVISLRVVFKVDISSVITTTTVLTAAIAFAMQNTLANAFNGFTVQIDAQMSRGNWITISEKNLFGQIVNVGFRYTTLRTLDNNQVLVPNSLVVQNIVVTHGSVTTPAIDRAALTTSISLPYEMPPEQARALLVGVLRDELFVLDEPPPVVRLQALADSSISYLLRFWIADPAQRNMALDAIQTKVWYAVCRAGWNFPFPHRQIITTKARESFPYSRAELLEGLHRSSLFGVMNDEEASLLADGAVMKVFAPGEAVVQQGEPGSSLFIVLEGEMQILVDGSEVACIGKGRMFGEMSLLTGEPRRATVRATHESTLAEISKETLSTLLNSHDQLLGMLSESLSRHESEISDHQANRPDIVSVKTKASDYLRKFRDFFGRGSYLQ